MFDAFLDWLEDRRYATQRLSTAMAKQFNTLPREARFLFGVVLILIGYLVFAVQQQQRQIEALPDRLRPVAAVTVVPTTQPAPATPTSSTQQDVALHTTAPDTRPQLAFDTIAYGGPSDATAFNTVRAQTRYTVVERSGPDWVRINIGTEAQPNIIWTKTDFLTGAGNVPDIATATPVPTQPAPDREYIYVTNQAPAAPPAPAPPAPAAGDAHDAAQASSAQITVEQITAACAGVERYNQSTGQTWVCEGRIGSNGLPLQYWYVKMEPTPTPVSPQSSIPPNPVQYNIVQENGSTVVRPVIDPNAPRLCTGFGDARDYDPNYASSPVCKPPQLAAR